MDNKKEEEKKEDDIQITFCEWTTHKGTRCCSKTKNNNKFCVKHLVLKNDYVVLKAETVEEEKLMCLTKKEVKFVPRSKEHIDSMLEKLGYESTETVEVLCEGGVIIDGDKSNESYIELNTDKTKFYYASIKGQHKIKEIKVKLIDFCKRKPIILLTDEYFCKECYVSLAKKRGYPTLKTLMMI